MATRRLQISEFLWFLFDNLKELESENFKTTLLEFYTAEDINVGRKLLLNDLEIIKKEKFKLPSRTIITHVQQNQILHLLPLYVIYNYKKVPNCNVNLNNKNQGSILETKIAILEEKLEKNINT